jgi:hypothetical protein
MLRIPFGDAVIVAGLEIPGLHPQQLKIVFRFGAPVDTDPSDRVIKPPPYNQPTGRTDVIMDLQADKKVPLSLEWTDEVGNPVGAPTTFTATYTVDDPTIINLTDNGDGTAVAAATGTLGTANVHLDASFDDDSGTHPVSGDLQLVVVAGLAERVNVVAGAPEEVTPDV